MIANTRMLAAFVLLLATALMSLAASAQQAAQNPRIAIVIGNAIYRDAALATTRQRRWTYRSDFAGGGV
jgi:Skp family chaperone for outer membrane proteins